MVYNYTKKIININRFVLGGKFFINVDKVFLPAAYKIEDDRYEFELYILINEYIRSDSKYNDFIQYTYAVVIKYLRSNRREKFKPRAVDFFNKVFDVGGASTCNDEKVSFIALHITFMFARVLSTSWYNTDVNKNTNAQDFAEYTIEDIDNVLNISKNITAIQLISYMVDELERTCTILSLTQNIEDYKFDRYSTECLLFKILKLVENSKNGSNFLSTRVVTRAPSDLGSKPSNFSVVHSKLDKNKPSIGVFGVYFCQPIYF